MSDTKRKEDALPKCGICRKRHAPLPEHKEHLEGFGEVTIFENRYSYHFEIKEWGTIIASGGGGHCDLDKAQDLLIDAIQPREGD